MDRYFSVVREDMRRTNGDIIIPKRATKHSMAYDIYSNDNYTILPNQIAKIWTDVKVHMKQDEGFIINVRSSMGGKFMLANTSGWVDSDYYDNPSNDGNLGVFLLNISNETQYIHKGDRIAQGMFIKYLTTDDDFVTTERTGGFGSTNV
jgi:dUTP pyrophosphatase